MSKDSVSITCQEDLARHVWETLRSVSISEDQVEWIQKGNTQIPYLKWSTGYLVLRKHFPCSVFRFTKFDNGRDGIKDEYCLMPDGSGYVEAMIQIVMQGHSFEAYMMLPIYGTGHRSIKGFDAAQLNNTRMRCKVKLLASIGLGIDLYGAKDDTVDTFAALDPIEYGIKFGLLSKEKGHRKTHSEKFFKYCVEVWNSNRQNIPIKDVQSIIDIGENAVQMLLTHIVNTNENLNDYKLKLTN